MRKRLNISKTLSMSEKMAVDVQRIATAPRFVDCITHEYKR